MRLLILEAKIVRKNAHYTPVNIVLDNPFERLV